MTVRVSWMIVLALVTAHAALRGALAQLDCGCESPTEAGSITCTGLDIADALECATQNMSAVYVESLTAIIINEFSDDALTSRTFENITTLPPYLERLIISHGELRTIEPDAFRGVNLRPITYLGLNNNMLSSTLAYSSLAGLESARLETLNLSNNRLAMLDQDLTCLFTSIGNVDLTGNRFQCDCCIGWLLDLTVIEFGDDQCSSPSELSGNRLTYLDPQDLCQPCSTDSMDCIDLTNNCTLTPVSCGSDDEDFEVWLIIVICVAGGIVLLLLVFLVFCCRRRYRKRRNKKRQTKLMKLANAQSSKLNILSEEPTEGKHYYRKHKKTIKALLKSTKKEDESEIYGASGGSHGGHGGHFKFRKHKHKKFYQSQEQIYDIDEIEQIAESFFSETVSIEALVEYLPELSTNWQNLGNSLGLPGEVLNIVNLAHGDHETRTLKMLESWVGTNDGQQMWRRLLDALNKGTPIEQEVSSRIYQVQSLKGLLKHISGLAKERKEKNTGLLDSWKYLLSKEEKHPEYCTYVFEVKGLDLLLYCNQTFQHDAELKETLFFLMDIFSKAPAMQQHLLRGDAMTAIRTELVYNIHPVASFTAGSIVAGLAYLGEDAWGFVVPGRNEMLTVLATSMKKWKTKTNMEKSGRGLQELDYLFKIALCQDERVAHWGVWAIYNHCFTHGNRYCPEINSSEKLQQLNELHEKVVSTAIKELCQQTIECCTNHKSTIDHQETVIS